MLLNEILLEKLPQAILHILFWLLLNQTFNFHHEFTIVLNSLVLEIL